MVTTAAYGTPIPLVIGQQRVPSTILRDGRTATKTDRPMIPVLEQGKILYGLCEAPVASIPIEYGNKDGKIQPGYTSGTAAHVSFPLAHVATDAPEKDASPEDLSFEVSSDIPVAGNGFGTYIETGSYQHQAADGTFFPNEDAVYLPANFVSDFHVCTTGAGATLGRWMVKFDRSANAIRAFWNALGGQGGDLNLLLCDGSTRSALRPAAGAMVQPRVSAVGNLVHVVWSVLSSAGSAVQIAHVWSADAGATWTTGQSLTLAARTNTTGAWKLSVAAHSSGEVWTSFQRRAESTGTSSFPYPSKGVVVGFLPAAANSSTDWIIPTSTMGPGAYPTEPVSATELCIFRFSMTTRIIVPGTDFRLRAPSILPLGGGKALLSAVFMDEEKYNPCKLVVLPIIANTEVHWDLPVGAFVWPYWGTTSKNITDITWLNANGFPSQSLNYQPSAAFDILNDASTQLVEYAVELAGTQPFAVLVLSQSVAWNGGASGVHPAAENHAMAGQWALPWGAWNGTSIAWTTSVLAAWKDQGFLAHAYSDPSGRVYIAMGKVDPGTDGLYQTTDYRTRRLTLLSMGGGGVFPETVFTYAPAPELNKAIQYQFWAQSGRVLASVREDEDLNGTYTVGIREIVQFSGLGDLPPSVICQRLLAADKRGLDIANVTFDAATWGKFDDYCEAMGIRFSLALTSQVAAWPLVCDILESANAMPYRSEGMIKVLARETAPIAANGVTYTPKAEHGASCVTIPWGDLRDGIQIEAEGVDKAWNSIQVNWKNRARNYADEPYQLEDSGAVSRKGRIPASAMDWNWICDPNVVGVCTWLRMRQQSRTGRVYKFEVSQKYMLHEAGDIVAISSPTLAARTVRILTIEEEDAGWIAISAEDAPISTSIVSPPVGGGGASVPTIPTTVSINLPIAFVGVLGGAQQLWCLLSWPSGVAGCDVYQSWDGLTFAKIGACTTPSPTGYLVDDMMDLQPYPGMRPSPYLIPGTADRAVVDFSESGVVPYFSPMYDWQAGALNTMLWVDGEILSYAQMDSASPLNTFTTLRHGLYGTAPAQHPALARVGALTPGAWTWTIPVGHNGQTCYLRFPTAGENVALVATYSVPIPA